MCVEDVDHVQKVLPEVLKSDGGPTAHQHSVLTCTKAQAHFSLRAISMIISCTSRHVIAQKGENNIQPVPYITFTITHSTM